MFRNYCLISGKYVSRDGPRFSFFQKGQSVNWCFEPSQPVGIISGLKETFINRHIVEKTNKAEIRPEEQIEKTESCRDNLWNEIQLKEP